MSHIAIAFTRETDGQTGRQTDRRTVGRPPLSIEIEKEHNDRSGKRREDGRRERPPFLQSLPSSLFPPIPPSLPLSPYPMIDLLFLRAPSSVLLFPFQGDYYTEFDPEGKLIVTYARRNVSLSGPGY